MSEVSHKSGTRCRQERGAGLVEFSLLVALIAVVTVASVRVLGQTIAENLNRSRAALGSGASGFCDPTNPNFPNC